MTFRKPKGTNMKILNITTLLFPLLLSAQEYTLNLSSEFSNGGTYEYTVNTDINISNEVKSDGAIVNSVKQEIQLSVTGNLTVIEITRHKQPLKIEFKVLDIKYLKKIGILDSIKVGDVITCEKDEKMKSVYMVNGVKAGTKDKELLEAIISVKNDRLPDDQESFGPKKPVQIGEKWPINKDAAASALKEMGIKELNQVKVDGEFRLDAVKQANGKDMAFVSGYLNISDIIPPFPPGITVTEGVMNFKGTGIIPLSGNHLKSEETNVIELKVSAGGVVNANGKQVNIEMKVMKNERNIKSWKVFTK